MFHLFLKRTAYVIALGLSVVFRQLVRIGSFPTWRRQANVAQIPKGPPSSSVANTDRFPKHQYSLRCLSVRCRFVLDDLLDAEVCFQPPSLVIRKV